MKNIFEIKAKARYLQLMQLDNCSHGEQLGRKGFTLIELLVVIAIISLLVSILLPSLKKTKDLANRAICMSNLRNINTLTIIYMNDNDGKVLPWIAWYTVNTGNPWQGILYYAGLLQQIPGWKNNILGCPAESQSPLNSYTTQWGHYGMNKNLGSDVSYVATKPRLGLSASQIRNPAMTYFLMDLDVTLYSNRYVVYDSIPTADGFLAYRHDDGVNILFFDSHCEWQNEVDIPVRAKGNPHPWFP